MTAFVVLAGALAVASLALAGLLVGRMIYEKRNPDND